jgi:hypothetical protein
MVPAFLLATQTSTTKRQERQMFRSQRRKLFRDKSLPAPAKSSTKRRSLPGRSWHRIATSVSTIPSTGLRLQAKLTIGAKNDEYEQEADRVADRVMQMPDSSNRELSVAQGQAPSIQPQCPECEEDLQRQPLEEEEEDLQMQPLEEEEEEEEIQPQPLEEEEEIQLQPLEEEEEIQPQPLEQEEEVLQTKKEPVGGSQTSARAAVNLLRGGGTPLPRQTRAYLHRKPNPAYACWLMS